MLRFTKIGLELAPVLIWMGLAKFRVSPVMIPTTPVWSILLKNATQGLTDVQGYQDWARAGPHVDLDGVGQVQSVPSNGINNSCLVNVTQ